MIGGLSPRVATTLGHSVDASLPVPSVRVRRDAHADDGVVVAYAASWSKASVMGGTHNKSIRIAACPNSGSIMLARVDTRRIGILFRQQAAATWRDLHPSSPHQISPGGVFLS